MATHSSILTWSPRFSSLPVPQLYSLEKPQSSLLLTCPRPLHKRVFSLCWLPHLQSASSPIFHNAKPTTTLFPSKYPSASPALPTSLLGVAGGSQSTVTSSPLLNGKKCLSAYVPLPSPPLSLGQPGVLCACHMAPFPHCPSCRVDALHFEHRLSLEHTLVSIVG